MEACRREIGTDHVHRRRKLFEPGLLRLQCERQVQHCGSDVLVGRHRLQPEAGSADWLDGDLVQPDAVEPQHLIKLKGERGIGRIDHHGLAAQIGISSDLGLHDQIIPAVVAAQHDDDIDLGMLGHGNGVVDRGVDDLIAALRQAVAQLLRAGRDALVHGKAVPGKEAFLLRGEQREILHALEDHGRHVGLCVRGRPESRQCQRRYHGHDAQPRDRSCHFMRPPPARNYPYAATL